MVNYTPKNKLYNAFIIYHSEHNVYTYKSSIVILISNLMGRQDSLAGVLLCNDSFLH